MQRLYGMVDYWGRSTQCGRRGSSPHRHLHSATSSEGGITSEGGRLIKDYVDLYRTHLGSCIMNFMPGYFPESDFGKESGIISGFQLIDVFSCNHKILGYDVLYLLKMVGPGLQYDKRVFNEMVSHYFSIMLDIKSVLSLYKIAQVINFYYNGGQTLTAAMETDGNWA
ncbi:hypothetical protein J6590_101103 [Homalodisca vitripennis]|nr:hypothetical protein J6590_101103 [Homalodisca vitripennis]